MEANMQPMFVPALADHPELLPPALQAITDPLETP